MYPIDVLLKKFDYDLINHNTCKEMGYWLNVNFPEATWTVTLSNSGSLQVTPVFRSAQQRTMCLLKWL